jgi:adenine-specific DNA-methyltransferase
MTKKQKLELTWVGKDVRPKLEPRILLEDAAKSYHAATRMGDADIFDNMLIHGDNLLALKALEQEFTGKVKCVFIDPPYNTGSAFTHYDDGLEHSLWLSLMRDRLEIIRRLLSDDGSLWITIDDNEAHYLKVMCDEIFGRGNFVANVVWQKKYAPANDTLWLSESHDHVLVYAKSKATWRPNHLPRSEKTDAAYQNPDNDIRGPWKAGDYTCAKSAEERPNLYYAITNPNTGEIIWPKRNRVWGYGEELHKQHLAESLIWWGMNGSNKVPSLKRHSTALKNDGIKSQTVWTWEVVGHTQDGRKEQINIIPDDPFKTPKPERLLERVLVLATNPSDLVLDSFAGSGTTGAVAHKMGRRWIMVELGDHCSTHIVPRLRKVIDGADKGGITEAAGWQGGGGFRYYELAPSLLTKDKWGREVISPAYDAAMLAHACAKLEGFTYAPSDSVWWQHRASTERDFIYVTTQTLQAEQLDNLNEDVGPERSLLVLCAAFRGKAADYPNLTIRKIPKSVAARCEWGRDDYSLNVQNLPAAPEPVVAEAPLPKKPGRGKAAGTADLFDGESGT